MKLKSELIHLYPNVLVACATVKSGNSIFCPLSVALSGILRPMAQDSQALGLFSAKERKRDAGFSKAIPFLKQGFLAFSWLLL